MSVDYSESDIVGYLSGKLINQNTIKNEDYLSLCHTCKDDLTVGDEIVVVAWTLPIQEIVDGISPHRHFTRYEMYCQTHMSEAVAEFRKRSNNTAYDEKDLIVFDTTAKALSPENGAGFGDVRILQRSPPEV